MFIKYLYHNEYCLYLQCNHTTKQSNKKYMKLSKIARDKLLTEKVKMLIALDANVSFSTVKRVIRLETEDLLHPKYLKAITKHTGLKESEIFEKEAEAVK